MACGDSQGGLKTCPTRYAYCLRAVKTARIGLQVRRRRPTTAGAYTVSSVWTSDSASPLSIFTISCRPYS